jgi:carboxyl-terminal processing protease
MEFKYESSAEKKLSELREVLSKKNPEIIPKKELEYLISSIEMMKKEDEKSSEEIITKLIQKEVIRRFYLSDEGIRYLIHEDTEIAKAVEVLSDNDRYNSIINKNN